MAELLDIAVEWNERIANPPRFGVLVDRMPKFDVWEKRPLELDQPGWHLYYAQDGEFASFFTWSGNADDGFAGWRRTVTLTDGTTEEIIGGWSGSPIVPLRLGYPPVVGVGVRDDAADFERFGGMGGLHMHLSLDRLRREVAARYPNAKWRDRNGEWELEKPAGPRAERGRS